MLNFYNKNYFTFYTLLLISMVVISINSLHLGQHHNRQISKQCCTLKGGFQCGITFKDCCQVPANTPKQKVTSQLCIKGGLLSSSQYCPGKKIIQDCNYCQKVCQDKKGIICGLNNGDKDQCCAKQDCIPDINLNLKMKKCLPGKQIKLTQCVLDMSISDTVFGKVQNIV